MNKLELITWNTLKNLNLDGDSEFSFSDRLARENGWSKEFALGAIEEYKKFVFLAKHAGHSVTPSVEVDEVWHLHMIYTNSYWNDMCKTIEFDLHHGPTKGGKKEADKFDDWYSKTLESYKFYFGVPPPKRYWPNNERRFAPNTIRKIDTKRFFIFKKPDFSLYAPILYCFLPILIIAGMIDGMDTAIIWILVSALVIYILYKAFRGKGGGGSGNGSSNAGSSSCGSSCGHSCSSSHSDSGGHSGCGSSGCGSSGCGGGGCGGGD